MEFQFRAEVRFDSDNDLTAISFSRFLPLDSGMPVPLGQTEFRVAVVVDPKRHRGWVSDIDLSQVEKHHGIRCRGAYIHLRADLDTDTAQALMTDTVNEKTRSFGERLLSAIELVHDILVDFARNENQQALIPPRRVRNDSIQQRLLAYDARWRVPEGWKLVDAASNVMVIQATLSKSIEPEDWRLFQEALTRGKMRVQPHRRLLANAFSHHEKNDLRAAVVECVAAWEMVMNDQVPRRLAEVEVAYDERDWKTLIEKAGLRASTKLFLALARRMTDITKHGDMIVEAIELRNTVMHNGRHRIDGSRVKELLFAMRAVCVACEDKPDSPGLSEKPDA